MRSIIWVLGRGCGKMADILDLRASVYPWVLIKVNHYGERRRIAITSGCAGALA